MEIKVKAMKKISEWNRKEIVFIVLFLAVLTVLYFLPTGFEKQIYVNAEGVKVRVLEVNNDSVFSTGLIHQGDQICTIEILQGEHKGEVVEAINLLSGKIELDKMFVPEDIGFALLERNPDNSILFANMVDHYRVNVELLLIGVFAVAVILFSGFTGVRTLFSFAFALLGIWKVLIPAMLNGHSPIAVALLFGNVLTIMTLLLVAGFTRKAFAAILGAVTASFATCLFAVLFGRLFNIHGAVMQWSESLLYSGYENLDLTALFQAGIYLACSGAILDLAIDISAALDEIKRNSPDIGRAALIRSGMTIGRSVVGTQTTTLLLAYMGSYISVMMVYMAQGTPFMSIFNSKSIASEILHTFVGCLGLVLVSPLTALICGFLYRNKAQTGEKELTGQPEGAGRNS